jgi:hypothetical protein
MVEIHIPFNEWSLSKLGLYKFATSRSKCYGLRGDTFSVKKYDTTLRFKILVTIKLPLWYIIENLYVAEGADDAEELKRVWKQIHPSFNYEKDRDKEYWVHLFKEVQ